jgi:aromatic-L-amino-acid decarboxylase
MASAQPTTAGLSTDGGAAAALLELAGARLATFIDGLEEAPAVGPPLSEPERIALAAAPGENPTPASDVMDRCMRAAESALESAGPAGFAYIPGSGLVESAIGELITRVTNRYVPLSEFAPGLVALEDGVLRWMASLFGMPEGANGVLTTGGSHAMLGMLVTARERMLGRDAALARARLYVSDQAHHCVAKAARVAGFPRAAVRVIPASDGRHLEPDALDAAIRDDRADGMTPFLVVATAGTTNSGAIDPLHPLADVARAHGLWYHVDACYGGFFVLTERGSDRLAGIERADSISLDPHKSLFMPFGTGALVMREPALLAAAHDDVEASDYLQDVEASALPDYARLGLELSREARGLRLWLPLHLHGVGAFRDTLDEKLDLAEHAHERLSSIPGLDVLERPELSIVAFRARAGDDASRALVREINATRSVFCSSTILDGRVTLRACILAVRTQRRHVDRLVDAVRNAVAEVSARPV